MGRDRRRAALISAVVVAVSLSLAACLEGGLGSSGAGVPVCSATDTVRILTTDGTLSVGSTKQLAYATSAPNPSCVRWSTSNGFVARMSSGGIIQGLAVGTVTVTAEAAANTDSTRFTVVAASGNIAPNP